jgi:hypothetical protein
VSFAAITLCVAPQRVVVVVVVVVVVIVYFVSTQSGNFWLHPRTRLIDEIGAFSAFRFLRPDLQIGIFPWRGLIRRLLLPAYAELSEHTVVNGLIRWGPNTAKKKKFLGCFI